MYENKVVEVETLTQMTVIDKLGSISSRNDFGNILGCYPTSVIFHFNFVQSEFFLI